MCEILSLLSSSSPLHREAAKDLSSLKVRQASSLLAGEDLFWAKEGFARMPMEQERDLPACYACSFADRLARISLMTYKAQGKKTTFSVPHKKGESSILKM